MIEKLNKDILVNFGYGILVALLAIFTFGDVWIIPMVLGMVLIKEVYNRKFNPCTGNFMNSLFAIFGGATVWAVILCECL